MVEVADRLVVVFFFNDTATTEIYTLSLHDALPIWGWGSAVPPQHMWTHGFQLKSRGLVSQTHISYLNLSLKWSMDMERLTNLQANNRSFDGGVSKGIIIISNFVQKSEHYVTRSPQDVYKTTIYIILFCILPFLTQNRSRWKTTTKLLPETVPLWHRCWTVVGLPATTISRRTKADRGVRIIEQRL